MGLDRAFVWRDGTTTMVRAEPPKCERGERVYVTTLDGSEWSGVVEDVVDNKDGTWVLVIKPTA